MKNNKNKGKKIEAINLIINLIRNNYQFEKDEMEKDEKMLGELAFDLMLKLENQIKMEEN